MEPQGALYCFPRLDPEMYPIDDDQQFVIDLLRAKKILVTHGTGFNWFEPDHFRLVTLPGGAGARGGDRPDRQLPRVLRASGYEAATTTATTISTTIASTVRVRNTVPMMPRTLPAMAIPRLANSRGSRSISATTLLP